MFRIVEIDKDLIGLHPNRGGYVVALGLAHQRMQQEAVADFQRRFLNVFVRAMSRVASLERDDLFPSTLAKCRASLARLEAILEEGAPRYVLDKSHATAETPGRGRGHVLRPGMRIFGGAEHRGGFLRAIDLVDLRELHDREPRSAFIYQRDIGAWLQRARGIFIDA